MKKIRVLSFLFIFIISCSSNSDNYESLSEEILGVFQEITLIVDKVTDELSAAQSIKDLSELNDKMENLTNRMSKISDLDTASKIFLNSSDYEKRFKNVLSNLFESTISISDKAYGGDIMDILMKILNPNK